MPVFMQFRLWLREGPVRERVLASVSGGLFIVVLVLAGLPLTDDEPGEAAIAVAGTDAAPAASTGGPNGVAGTAGGEPESAGSAPEGDGAVQAGAASGASGGEPGTGGDSTAAAPLADGTSRSGANGCEGLGASAPGILPDQVRVGVSLINLAGAAGNTAFDIRPDMEEIVAAVVDEINKTGGVACGRKLAAKIYQVNPIDQTDQQSKCLQMVQDKIFVNLDIAGYARANARACFVQHKLPHQVSTVPTEGELKTGYPYLYGNGPTAEQSIRNAVLELADLGYFAPPKFAKLGLLTDTCDPPVAAELETTLAKVGIKGNQISKFTLSCQLIAPPSEVAQAVLQHKTAGATHVFLASSLGNSQRYTQIAGQQEYRPLYGASEYGTLTTSAGTWDRSAAGAIAVGMRVFGELNAGIRNDGVKNCERIVRAHGLPGIQSEKEDATALLICDQLFFFRQGMNNAGPNPTRHSYVETGVGTMGPFRGAIAPAVNWNRPGKVSGGDFRRAGYLDGGCGCWKVRDTAFKPAA